MTITRDVIIDLLPAYAAGEASADTRKLVDEFMQGDPSVQRLLRALQAEDTGEAAPDPPPVLETEAINRTRAMIRRRGWTLGLALFTTLVPFTFGDTSFAGTFWLLRDQPWTMLTWVVAAPLWWSYYRLGQRLRGIIG